MSASTTTKVRAKDLMTSDVLTVDGEMTIQQLAAFFRDHEVSGAPVTGRDGELLGVVSLVDIARIDSERPDSAWDPMVSDYYHREALARSDGGVRVFRPGSHQVRVRDIMQTRIHSVGRDAEVAEIVKTMLGHHIHRVLVIEDDQLLGVISTYDLLETLL